jgi:hypothetical protein
MAQRKSRNEIGHKTKQRIREAGERVQQTQERVEDTEHLAQLRHELARRELSEEAQREVDADAVDARDLAAFDAEREGEMLEAHQAESSEYAGELGESSEEGRETAERVKDAARETRSEAPKDKLAGAERAARRDQEFFSEQAQEIQAAQRDTNDALAQLLRRVESALRD